MLTHLALLVPLTMPGFLYQGSAEAKAPVNAVEYYTPQLAPARDLARVVSDLFEGGSVGIVVGQQEIPPTLLTYGKSIVVRYRDDKIGELVTLLKRLDEQWSGEEGTRRDTDIVTLEYRARHVMLNSLSRALVPFTHPIFVSDGTAQYQVQNLSYLEERGLIVVRGPMEEVVQIEAVLKRIDVPQPQVTVTCHLVRGQMKATAEQLLPAELTQNLKQLVPFEGFESLALGILRSDALTEMQLTVDYSPGEQFQLQLRPRAFDPESRSLTFDQCAFSLLRGEDEHRSQQRFTTSATIRTGEYTVLGAVGAEPIFVVLHVSLLSE